MSFHHSVEVGSYLHSTGDDAEDRDSAALGRDLHSSFNNTWNDAQYG